MNAFEAIIFEQNSENRKAELKKQYTGYFDFETLKRFLSQDLIITLSNGASLLGKIIDINEHFISVEIKDSGTRLSAAIKHIVTVETV